MNSTKKMHRIRERDLVPGEANLERLNVNNNGSTNVWHVVEFENLADDLRGPINLNKLQTSVESLFRKYPATLAKVVKENDHFKLITNEQYNEICSYHVVEEEGSAWWSSWLERTINKCLPHINVALLENGSKNALIVGIQHCTGDGRSLDLYVKDLIAVWFDSSSIQGLGLEELADEELVLDVPAFTEPKDALLKPDPVKNVPNDLWPDDLDQIQAVGLPFVDDDSLQGTKTWQERAQKAQAAIFATEIAQPGIADQLIGCAKAHGLTINDLVCAAFCMSLFEEAQGRQKASKQLLKLAMPVDLRRLTGTPTCMSMAVEPVFAPILVQQGDSLVRVAHRVHQKVRDALPDRVNSFLATKPRDITTGSAGVPIPILSNIGVSSLYNNNSVARCFQFFSVAGSFQLGALVQTVKPNLITFSFYHELPTISRNTCETVARNTIEKLKKL